MTHFPRWGPKVKNTPGNWLLSENQLYWGPIFLFQKQRKSCFCTFLVLYFGWESSCLLTKKRLYEQCPLESNHHILLNSMTRTRCSHDNKLIRKSDCLKFRKKIFPLTSGKNIRSWCLLPPWNSKKRACMSIASTWRDISKTFSLTKFATFHISYEVLQ